MINECKCMTGIHYNYAVYHPETKHVMMIFGSECIMRWHEGKLMKE